MATLSLIASLEAELDESEEKQAGQQKTHSSSRALDAAPEPLQIEIASSSEEEDNASRKSHCSSQSYTNDRDNVCVGLEGQLKVHIAEDSEIRQESQITSRDDQAEERQIYYLEKAQNESLLVVDGVWQRGNDKRGFSDAQMDDLQNFQRSFRQHDTTTALSRNNELCPEERSNKFRKRSSSQSTRARNALAEVGYEVSTMPGRSSPGRKRKICSTSKEAIPVQDTADDPEPPLSPLPPVTVGKEVLEIADSQEKFENEGVVENSKRIKRDKQHRTETAAVKSAKKDKEYEYAHIAPDNARDSEDSHENNNVPPKRAPWVALQRYKSSENSLRNYGKPKDSNAVPVNRPGTNTMRNVIGGPKPRNTLSNDPHNATANPNPPFKQPKPIKRAENGFDLSTGDDSGRPPAKRQKTEGSRTRAAQSHKQVIEIDAGSSTKRDTASVRSSHSHTHIGHVRNSWSGDAVVPEYRAVREAMKAPNTRRRTGWSSNAQTLESGAREGQTKFEDAKRTVIRHGRAANGDAREHPEDPISDEDPIGPEVVQMTRPQVVILPDKGNTNLKHPRERDDNGRRSSTTARNQTAATSHYVSADSDEPKSRISSRSTVVAEEAQNNSGATTRQQKGSSIQKKSASKIQKAGNAYDLSQDELGMDEPHSRKTTHDLSAKKKQTSGSIAAAKPRQSSEDSNYSQDDRVKADMITTSIPKRRKQSATPGRYQVIQVFSDRYAWLSHGNDDPWWLNMDLSSGILTFSKADGHHVPDLDMLSKSFHRIECSQEDGKVVISKPSDDTAKYSPRVYLQLASRDDSEDFYNHLCRIFPGTIGHRVVDSLDKVFVRTQTLMQNQKPKKDEEANDIQQAKRQHAPAVGAKMDKAQAAKQNGSRMIDQLRTDAEDTPHPGRGRLVQGRNTRSSIETDTRDVDYTDESRRPTKALRLDGNNPHATRSRNANGELTPRKPSNLRSPSPERWTESNPEWATLHNWQSSVIYPKEGKNKATVDKQDIERLDEGQFLNDNLIMFYLLKLERELAERDPALSKRVYFHNTFFYERLTKAVKGKKGINYSAVERWTSKVDLFSYDYIIVPVNEHSHWYVAIIYNAPKLLNPEPEVIEAPQSQETTSDATEFRSDIGLTHKSSPVPSPNPPTSPVEDSVGGPMRNMSLQDETDKEQFKDIPMDSLAIQTAPKRQDGPGDILEPHSIQERTAQEATPTATGGTSKPATLGKRGRKKSFTPAPRRFSPKEPKIITLDSLGLGHSSTCTNLRDYLIEEGKAKRNVVISSPRQLGMTAINIPTQKNYCDCGLFLLSYVECFLMNPDDFTQALLGKVDIEVSYDFTKAPEMRSQIRELLFDLQAKQVAEKAEKDLAKQKGSKGKKPLKTCDGLATPAGSGSREASRSARPSADPECPKPSKSLIQAKPAQNDTSSLSPNLRNQPRHSRLLLPPDKVVQAPSLNTLPPTQPGASRTNALEVVDESPRKDHRTPQLSQEPRVLESPSPEMEGPSSPVRDRTPTPPHPRTLPLIEVDDTLSEDHNPRTPLYQDDQTTASSSLEPAAKPPATRLASNVVDMTHDEPQKDNDQEMLLPSDNIPAPVALDIPSAPGTPSRSQEKQQAATAPESPSNRKSSPSKGSRSVQYAKDLQGNPELGERRDSSDRIFIEKYRWKGTRTKLE